mgnify:CR=1 FL=1
METVVIDANLGVGLVRLTPYSAACRQRMERWLRGGTRLVVPSLWDYEIAAALRRLWAQKVLSREEAAAALELVFRLRLERVPPDTRLLTAALDWAERLGQNKTYDAQYAALAERLGAELWSADERLANALKAQGADWAHWVGET